MNAESSITLGIAVAGLTLGIVNYVTDLFRRRHRAVVSVRHHITSLEEYVGIGATVVNTGETAFTVCDVGFDLKGERQMLVVLKDGDALPKVLQPGMHCEVVLPRSSCLDADWRDIEGVFVRLPTGKKFHSKKFSREFLRLAGAGLQPEDNGDGSQHHSSHGARRHENKIGI